MKLQLSVRPQFSHAGQTKALAARDAALLAWLALEGPTARSRLATLLWPERDEDAARNTLRQRLFQLKHQLGAELVSGNHTLALAAGVRHDLAPASRLLHGVEIGVDGEFGAWLSHQRERRDALQRQRHTLQVQQAEDGGDHAGALVLAEEWLAQDLHSEAAHRSVMRLHYLLGDRAAAERAYARCEQMLAQSLGVRPAAETLALRAMVERAEAPARAVAAWAPVPPVVLRPPRLIGREAEIDAATQAWARAQVVALVAEAGMGKTRLLQHLLPGSGARQGVVSVAARPGDAGVPLATLARLLRALAGTTSAVGLAPSARRELARVLPEWAAAELPAGEGQRLALQRAVRALLAQCPGLVAVAIDDLHFADAASLQMLQALLDDGSEADSGAAATGSPPLTWALAYRPAEAGSALQALQSGLLEHARLQAVALAPLGIDALADLVDSLALPGLAAGSGHALAPGLLRRTGGNPLFVLETLKQAWVERGLAALALPDGKNRLPRPPSVLRLIERRITQLSPGALALARCAAVAGQDFSTRLATRVLGVPALALADAWAELETAQILRDQAFVHDLYFEATLASVPAAIARHLHGEIAEHLQADGRTAPATLARHWLAADQREQALPHLERAAQAAAQVLDPVEAARLWAQLAALRHAAGAADAAFAAAREAVLALRASTSGPPLADAIDRLQALAGSTDQQACVHELRAAMFFVHGDWAAAADSLAQGLALLAPAGPPALRANLLNMQGLVLRRVGQPQAARAALLEALALAREPGAVDADLPALLNNLALVLQEDDDHLGAIALMQEAAALQVDPLVRARVLNNLAISLEERGQALLAREQRLAAARAVQGVGGAAELNLAVSLGANARNLGRYRDALAHLAHAQALAADERHWREEDLLRQFAAVWLDLGRINLAREAIERAAALQAGPASAPLVAIVQARLALALGQGATVPAALAPVEAELQARGDRRALRRLWLVLAQALAPEAALRLLEPLAAQPALRENAAAGLPVQVRLAQALLQLAQPARALDHAQRAAHWLQAVQPLEMTAAEVQLTLARCALAAGDAAGAMQAAQAGSDWVEQVAQDHLDEVYRDGWRQRNPVNRDLLALRAQLTAPTNAALTPPGAQ